MREDYPETFWKIFNQYRREGKTEEEAYNFTKTQWHNPQRGGVPKPKEIYPKEFWDMYWKIINKGLDRKKAFVNSIRIWEKFKEQNEPEKLHDYIVRNISKYNKTE